MGSEGYLINQFIAPQTKPSRRRVGRPVREPHPVSPWRSCAARARGPPDPSPSSSSPLDARPRRGRQHVGRDRGARARPSRPRAPTIINTGIGWHEARIPTIATMVPRAAFSWVTRRLKGEVGIPPDRDQPHQRSRPPARPCSRAATRHGLDGAPVPRRCRVREQGAEGRADEINTRIGCNQACLDQDLRARHRPRARQPYACYESVLTPHRLPRRESAWR